MKFVPYVLKNILRNKVRTLFTVLSIGLMLFLVTVLYAYLTSAEEIGATSAQYNRVVVNSSQGLTQLLPRTHLDDVAKTPGARFATSLSWVGGKYRAERANFSQFATDSTSVFKVYDEYSMPESEANAWEDDKTGCVAGRELAEEKGWKIGDKIVLAKDIYPVDYELTLRGIFDGPDKAPQLKTLFFHWEYLDQGLRDAGFEMRSGYIGIVVVKAEAADAIPNLMSEIDRRVTNRQPVRAMTEQAFQNSFMEMAGNVQAFIRNISLAVVFALVCVAGNAMAMSMRERTREVAVLKAVGFQRRTILSMILGEALAIAAAGGLLGSFGAKLVCDLIPLDRVTGVPQLAQFYVPTTTAAYSLAFSGLIGLASGIVPAWRAAQSSVVDGLRKVV